jgi:hypothetical protein
MEGNRFGNMQFTLTIKFQVDKIFFRPVRLTNRGDEREQR